MMIVRVSSLFFNNPCVERQLCIVNRGYAIVTEQQCFKIEQIRFVQHYKRKAKESKATIQPFVTEGSNGSYKRGACSGNRSKKNTLQGNIAELGNNSTNVRKRPEVNEPGN